MKRWIFCVLVVGVLGQLSVGGPLLEAPDTHAVLAARGAAGTDAGDAGGDAPWPMFCHDSQRTGRSPHDTSGTWGYEVWRCPIDSGGHASPAIGPDDTLYVGSIDWNIYAVNPDGTVKWMIHTNGMVTSSPAIGHDGTLYIGSWDGNLYAVYPNGTLRWTKRLDGSVHASPAIASDGTVYVGTLAGFDGGGTLYALAPDGSIRWTYHIGSDMFSSPALGHDGTVYVGSNNRRLHAVHPNGTLSWTFKTEGGVQSTPTVAEDGTVYVGSGDRHLYAVHPNGTLQWRYQTDGAIDDSSPVIAPDGTIYVGSTSGCLHAVHPTGTRRWVYDTGGEIIASPAVDVNGIVYVSNMDARVVAVNPDGTERWTHILQSSEPYDYRHSRSSPSIAPDGTIYLCSWMTSEYDAPGYLHAIRAGFAKDVEVTRPRDGYLYLLDREIMPTRYTDTRIIGTVTVEASVVSRENVTGVAFYVDNERRYTDTTYPYRWEWNTWHEGTRYREHIWVTKPLAAKVSYNDGDVIATKCNHFVKVFSLFK